MGLVIKVVAMLILKLWVLYKCELWNKVFKWCLDSINQNYSSFNEYFTKDLSDDAVSFPSLGKDAKLVVPTPTKSGNWINNNKERFDYKNISQFTKNAPLKKQYNFWQEVANELEKSLDNSENTPKWLSTHGLGIHYLHVRIDSRPKYYSWSEYSNWPVEELKKDRWQGKDNNLKGDGRYLRDWGNSILFGFLSAIFLIGIVLIKKKIRLIFKNRSKNNFPY